MVTIDMGGPRPPNSIIPRVERWIWYAFLATLVWQTRIILWQADLLFWEWRSASLWMSDALLVGLLIVALWRGWRPHLRGFDLVLGFFFSAAILSLGNADHVGIGLYQLGRLAYGVLLYLYLRQWALRTFDADMSAVAFVIGAMGQAALGIAQFGLQHDIGVRWAGETLLRTDMRGVAVFYDLAHQKILRAYGTMPHPNVLAAHLVLALAALLWLWVRHPFHKLKAGRETAAFAGALLLWAFFLTFSRTMILAGGAAFAVVFGAVCWPRVSRHWENSALVRRRFTQAAIAAAVVAALFLALNWNTVWARMTIAASDESVRLRVRYAQDALSSGTGANVQINWTGVGIGNFTTWLMRYDVSMPRFMYQPVHNVYLLAYTELGLLGVLLWLVWLGLLVRHAWYTHADQPALRVGIMAILGAVFFIALFDHFFWTLQQGRLLWWLALAVAAGKERAERL